MSRLRNTCAWPCRHAKRRPRGRFWTETALEALSAIGAIAALGSAALYVLTR